MAVTTQIVQENPQIEAYRLGLLADVQDLVKAASSGGHCGSSSGLSSSGTQRIRAKRHGARPAGRRRISAVHTRRC
jgi:hypothetical protein